ncbi:MAG: chemotaxis protein CheD, partial [Deltaproteobacteria bacterium]|nr:chemotaxis protein CheD [Deltaproteobacteria bacterium]
MDRYLVASGEFKVSAGKKGFLEACLGSCVGLTVCDRKANVGGLLHVLLPEPVGSDSLWEPDHYATTGVPLFMNALCEAGAKRDRMEACLAGGALVGPVSEMDLNLDIGGRTLDMVEYVLTWDNIPIKKMETGGFFTCRLSLDLDAWESHIEPLGMSDSPLI